MNISSKLKKIISLMMIPVVLIGTVVLPVSAAEEAGHWGDNEYHEAYEDFSDCPKYTKDDLVYDGVLSTDVRTDFNIKKQYGLDWTTDTGFYMSRPFSLRRRWDYGDSSGIVNFTGDYANVNQLFSKDKFDAISSSFVKDNNLDLSSYDVYYTLDSSYSPSTEYGYLTMMYYFVPKGKRIAFSNQNKNEDGSGEIKYGLWLSSDGAVSDIASAYSTIWRGYIEYGTEGKSVLVGCNGFYKSPFSSFLGMAHINLLATNIPVFTKADAAKQYIISGQSTEDPTNKIPSKSESAEKVGADAFYWDSLKCKLARDGEYYKVMFDYKYSVPDMVSNPSDYVMYVDVTQDYKYKAKNNSNVLNGQSKVTSTSCLIGASPGHTVCDAALFYAKAYGSALSEFCVFGATAVSDLLGRGYDWVDINFYNSYITVYVELVHVTDGGNGLFIKDKVSSDIRSFTFDALTLKSLDDTSDIDSSENEVDVKTKDTIDSSGNVTDRTVTGSTVINNITNTVNNYYYDSDGNKKESSGSSIGDSLSDIASGLIKFIKTLVTEGLPAALEVLKTLIKSVSDLVGFAFDQIGDIGAGTSQGLIAVLKAIPTPLWGICSVGLIVFVIAGVLKKIF